MNTTGKIKSKNSKKTFLAKGMPLGRMLCAVIFIFSLVTASCRFFFDTHPFGLAVVSAASGVYAVASAVIGTVIGSLLGFRGGQTSYGVYLALLSVLLFAARIVVSWWLGQGEERTRRQPRKSISESASTAARNNGEPKETMGEDNTNALSILDTGQKASSDSVIEGILQWFRRNGTADRLRNADGRLLRENIVVRMAMGALSAMFMGVLSAAEGGFSYYSLFGAVFSVLLSPILVYMIYGATDRHMRLSGIREAGIYAMAAIFTYALSAVSPAGFNLGYSFAFAASLAAATCFGSIRGMVTGLLCGILLEPLYAPLFALSAGVCGLIYGFSSQLAVMSALSVGIAWGIYVAGFHALGSIVPPLAASAAVMLPLYHFELVRLPPNLFGLTKNIKEAEKGTIAAVMHRKTSRHLTDLSECMKSISNVVYHLAGRLAKPARWEFREMCEDAFDRYCEKCPMYPTCYGAAYEKTALLIERITEELAASGTASASVIPLNFTKKCCNMGRILDEVNFQASRRAATKAQEDKLSVVAGDYEMMGELLSECLDYDKNEIKEDGELTAKLSRLLAYNDFRAGCVTAYGVRHKRIFVNDIDLSGVRLGAEDIRELFEGICGFPMSVPEFEIDGPVVSMRIQSVFRFGAECGRASLSLWDVKRFPQGENGACNMESEEGLSGNETKEVIERNEIKDKNKKTVSDDAEGESGSWEAAENACVEEEIRIEVTDSLSKEPCGDVITSFEADGRYYMLISDGMGSGREAAVTSSAAAMFLERMLTAGASMETSLKMLNKLIRAGERECSATIDLAEIDLSTGEAKFVKSGAAPSFVIRDGSIYRLQSKTVPIGIIRALDAEMIKFDVEEGDIIVMLSDGVARSFEECPWLLDMLSSDPDILEGSPRKAAEKIVRTAANRKHADDITAGVIRISPGVR